MLTKINLFRFLSLLCSAIYFTLVNTPMGYPIKSKLHTEELLVSAVYFAPQSRFLISEEQLKNNQIHLVTSYEGLKDYMEHNLYTSVIYLHRDTVDQVNPEFIQEQYEMGRLIGIFEAPVSALRAKIRIEYPFAESIADINMNAPIEASIVFSLYHALMSSSENDEGYRIISHYFSTFEEINFLVQTLAQNSIIIETPPSSPPSPFTNDIWIDSTGGMLYGESYTTPSGGNYWGHGYSDYLTSTPYFQQVYIETFNDCGGWHQISSTFLKQEYTSSPTQTYTLLGSSQCGNNFTTEAAHASQRYPSSSTYVSGNTDASCQGSNC